MFIYKEGDTSKGPCEKCRKLVTTTFRYAPLKYNGLVIPEVLQDFCDTCGSPVSIPHQSSYRIREFREQYNHALEFRVPSHHTDILLAIGMTHKVSQKPNSLCRIISELYLSKIIKPDGQDVQRKIIEALDEDLAKGKSKGRLSCLFPDTTYSTLKTVADEEKTTSSTIVKGIIVMAKHDILDNEDKKITKEFEEFAASRL
jgi:hypothetical protein